MSQDRLPPPDGEACLVRLRPSTQKGGTIIVEDVTDWATHDRRVCTPDGYRPSFCPTCGEHRLHVHDYRERVLRADPDTPAATIVRHVCVACQAIWQVLPALIARHLSRTWPTIAHTLTPDAASAPSACRWPSVPTRTVRRWRSRWQRPAHALERAGVVRVGALHRSTVHRLLAATGVSRRPPRDVVVQDCEAKGVIERWHRSWRDEVGDELPDAPLPLGELNAKHWAWLAAECWGSHCSSR